MAAGTSIFTLMGSVLINTDKADKSLHKTEGIAGKLGKGLGSGIGKAAKFGAALTVAGATAAVALGGVALKAAVSFEEQMANVATLLDGDVKSKIGNLGGAVKDLSSDTGTSIELLTDGLYQVVSAFGETEDSMKILEIATKGAAAGNATVTDAVNLLSAVTKGYGDTSKEAAQQTSDLAFLTVKLGQTTFPELASSMGKVIPLAGALKVEQEDLFGAMATLTGVTGNTAEVSTQLRGVMQGLLKPSESMTSALTEMGYESGGAAIESLGLQGVLDGLKGTVDGNDTALLSMFGSVEAGGAVLALTGAQSENFTNKTNAMGEAAGATEAAFKTQQATVSAMMKKIKSSFEVVMITLGEKLLPLFSDFLEWVLDHMPEIEKVIEVVFEKIGEFVNVAIDIFKNFLIPIFVSIYDWTKENWPIIQAVIVGVFEAIKLVWENVLQPVLTLLWDTFKGIVKHIQDNWDTISDRFKIVFGIIKTVWDTVLSPVLTALWDDFKEIVTWVQTSWGFISDTFSTVFDAIKSDWDTVLKPVLGFFLEGLTIIYDFIADNFGRMQTTVENTFSGIGTAVDAVTEIFGWLIDKVKSAWEWLTKWNDTEAKDKNPSYGGEGGGGGGVGGRGGGSIHDSSRSTGGGYLHSLGLSNVPYDNYPATLHKDEAVLTAKENKDYKQGKSGASYGNVYVTISAKDIIEMKNITDFFNKIGQVSKAGVEVG